MNKAKNRLWRLLTIIGASIIAIMIAFAIYVSNYYHADTEAIEAYALTQNVPISKEEITNGVLAYIPEEATAGFIFYPGGKVEYTAYEPLMLALAEKGILSILIEMPFNLAVFDMNAADGIQGQFPNVENWYIGGHSLGGSMAASYVAKHAEAFDGLVLLASYSTADLSDSNLNILSIYGSEDKVLNAENYLKYKANLPDNFTEYLIEGGCHAYFGMYGSQKGDGIPSIENVEQIDATALEIQRYIFEEIVNS